MRRGGIDERKLRELLREAPLPGADAAERRGRGVVMAAFDERAEQPQPRRTSLPRLAVAVAAVTLLAALLLSPAGASVRHWIGDVFEPGVRNAEPALTRIPGGGRLAVTSPAGPWVVQPNGERRLLGHYREATWSPHGLYLAAVSGRTLTALQPDGTPRWSIDALRRVADPRWSPSGYRIAYRAGGELRVVHADGSGDRRLARSVAPLAPAWSPSGLPVLAYVTAPRVSEVKGPMATASSDTPRRLVVRDVDSGEVLASAPALAAVSEIAWLPGASGILDANRRAIRIRPVSFQKLAAGLAVGPGRRLPLPHGTRLREFAASPSGRTIAALLSRPGAAAPREEVDLIDRRSGDLRRLFGAPSRLGQVSWSPQGTRLLITWPAADQWLFVPLSGHGRLEAVGDISRQFAPGTDHPGFPRVAGWCCPHG